MDINKIYKLYLKRSEKDTNPRIASDPISKEEFKLFWDMSEFFRVDIINYISQTESII